MKTCAHCGNQHCNRKYCCRACYRAAITIIDVTLIASLARYGLTTEAMELYVPATAGAIRKAMSRQRAA